MCAVSASALGRFEVLGAEAEVVVVGTRADALVDRAAVEFERLERAWSPSHPASEIARLNTNGGRAQIVTFATLTLVEAAVSAWYLTGGRFDPTAAADGTARGGCAAIELDTAASTVRLPADVAFDPGAIGKGLAADLVLRALRSDGAAGVMVRVGDEVCVSGTTPTGTPWSIALDAGDTAIELGTGAVSTSGAAAALVDPTSKAPLESDVLAVHVVAAQAWQTEALAKAIVVAGSATGLEMAERRGAAARVITHAGDTRTTLSFRRLKQTTVRR
jgi:FAD:protein FMN transferase